MKNIKTFEGFSSPKKEESPHIISDYTSQKMVRDEAHEFPCTFSIMTKELLDRLHSKGISPIAYSIHGYNFMCESEDELNKFKSDYKKGNKYNGETITGNAIFKFNVY